MEMCSLKGLTIAEQSGGAVVVEGNERRTPRFEESESDYLRAVAWEVKFFHSLCHRGCFAKT
jgi:hypothetical protein